MKIYVGDNKKKSKKITFQDLLINKLREAGFKMDNGDWSDENHSWVGIVQESDGVHPLASPRSQIVVNITFDTEEDSINSVNVYVTPIVTIVDDDNSKKLI